MDRRDFIIQTAGLSLLQMGASSAWAKSSPSTPKEGSMLKGKIFELEHSLTPLPFKATQLSGISEKLIQSHWENNYGGSVKALNAIRKDLAQALNKKDSPAFVVGGLKREHLLRTGSVVLHELYFGNLGGNGKCGKELQKKIAESQGSFENWEQEFRKVATSLGGGSGWVIFGYNYHFKTLETYWSWDHMHAPVGTIPLLVMDMYEHSYQMDYGAAAAKYVDAFFRNINWEKVEERFDRASKLQWS